MFKWIIQILLLITEAWDDKGRQILRKFRGAYNR